MRPSRLLVVLMTAAMLAGCATAPVPQPETAAGPGDLDSIIYGSRLAPQVAPAPGPVPVGLPLPPPMPAPPVPVAVPPPLVAATAVMPQLVPPDEPYTLDSGDKLRVVVFGQDGLSNSYAVDAGGNIAMPLIGAVRARGLTVAQLSGAIAARLRQGFIREPHVAVEVEAYRPFFILGEVTFPGQYPYVANMTVETAVAIAGGFTPRAQRNTVELSRAERGDIVRGAVPVFTPVRPGDTIVVAERWF